MIYPLMHQLSDYPFVAEHARAADWARDAGAEVIDLLPAFQGQDAAALWVSSLDHHPNARAHLLAATAIAAVLATSGLPRAQRTRCDALPAPEGLENEMRAACDRRDVRSALTLADATARTDGSSRPISRMMAAVAVWRAQGTPEEASARAHAEQIVATGP